MAITNADPDVLEPIIHDISTLGSPALNINGTQFNVRPLLRFAIHTFSSNPARSRYGTP